MTSYYNSNSKFKIKNENEKNKTKSTIFNSNITPLQDFFFKETDFHFCQFLSNFFKYFFLNFLLSHLYNIFTIYFPGNYSLLKSCFSTISKFSCFLTSALNLPSNSTTASFAFSKSFSLSYVSCSAINFFHHTKYFITSHTFFLFRIFSNFHSLAPSTQLDEFL